MICFTNFLYPRATEVQLTGCLKFFRQLCSLHTHTHILYMAQGYLNHPLLLPWDALLSSLPLDCSCPEYNVYVSVPLLYGNFFSYELFSAHCATATIAFIKFLILTLTPTGLSNQTPDAICLKYIHSITVFFPLLLLPPLK